MGKAGSTKEQLLQGADADGGGGGRPAHHVAPSGFFGRFGPRFVSPWPSWEGDKNFGEVMGLMREFNKYPSDGYLTANAAPTRGELAAAFPLEAPDYEALAAPPAGGTQVMWLGHATVLGAGGRCPPPPAPAALRVPACTAAPPLCVSLSLPSAAL
jgi:hypothetical protein